MQYKCGKEVRTPESNAFLLVANMHVNKNKVQAPTTCEPMSTISLRPEPAVAHIPDTAEPDSHQCVFLITISRSTPIDLKSRAKRHWWRSLQIHADALLGGSGICSCVIILFASPRVEFPRSCNCTCRSQQKHSKGSDCMLRLERRRSTIIIITRARVALAIMTMTSTW